MQRLCIQLTTNNWYNLLKVQKEMISDFYPIYHSVKSMEHEIIAVQRAYIPLLFTMRMNAIEKDEDRIFHSICEN